MKNINGKSQRKFFIFVIWLSVTTSFTVMTCYLFSHYQFRLNNQQNYVDQRSFCGLGNALNVLSNGVLITAGCYWLNWILKTKNIYLKCRKGLYETRLYTFFFVAIILAGIQSAWYHLFHTQLGLLGAYLLSNIVMFSLLSAIIAERFNLRLGLHSCIPFTFISMLLAFYCYANPVNRQLCYFLSYLIPSLIIMAIIIANPKYKGIRHIAISFCNVFIGLGFSLCDETVYILTKHMISGQSLHNIYMGIAVTYMGYYLEQRSTYEQRQQRIYVSKNKLTSLYLKVPLLTPSQTIVSLNKNLSKHIFYLRK